MSSHHRRVQERLVALDVSHPQQVRSVAAELAVHQVRCGARPRQVPAACFGARQAADVVLAHHRAQQLLVSGVVVDLGQLSLDAPPPVRAPGPLPDLCDDVSEPGPAHSAR